MAFVGLGASELLLLLLLSGAGRPELTSLLSPQDYFKTRGIDVSVDKMVELAAQEPKDGKTQIAQLLAMRYLTDESAAFKKAPSHGAQRKLIEDIAAGRKAQDAQGFARDHAVRLLAVLDGKAPPRSEAPLDVRADALAWFPAAATFVGALDSRVTGGQGPPPRFQVAEFLKAVPKDMKEKLYQAVEMAGNVRIDRVAFAFIYEEKGQGQTIVRLTGKVHPERFGAVLKMAGLKIKEGAIKDDGLVLYEGRETDPVVVIIGDSEVLIAGHEEAKGGHVAVLQKALAARAKKTPNAASGALKADLEKLPAKASGFLVGLFPEDARRQWNFLIGALPAKMVAHLQRAGNAYDVVVNAEFDTDEQAKNFVQATGKLRAQGLDAIKNAPPLPIPGINLNSLQTFLESVQLQGQGKQAELRVLLPDDVLQMLPALFLRATGEVPLN